MLEVREHIPLAPLTTFQIGGPARYLAEVRTEDDLREAIQWAKDKGTEFVILAGGSNVLVPDRGLNKLVIHYVEGDFSIVDGILRADAGCNLLRMIRAATEHNLGGWEKLAGIPGTIGGAVRGNAGAFGTEIKDVLVSARAVNGATGEVRDFVNAECDFSYRHSFFKDNPEWIITQTTVRLSETQYDISNSRIEETIAEREQRHLQNVRAAGSFFMNPVAPQHVVAQFENEKQVKSRENRVPAGWLIEKVGLKGHQVGGAQASLMHPNYLVNVGDATAHDVGNLAQIIKLEVEGQFGVTLTEEAALLK